MKRTAGEMGLFVSSEWLSFIITNWSLRKLRLKKTFFHHGKLHSNRDIATNSDQELTPGSPEAPFFCPRANRTTWKTILGARVYVSWSNFLATAPCSRYHGMMETFLLYILGCPCYCMRSSPYTLLLTTVKKEIGWLGTKRESTVALIYPLAKTIINVSRVVEWAKKKPPWSSPHQRPKVVRLLFASGSYIVHNAVNAATTICSRGNEESVGGERTRLFHSVTVVTTLASSCNVRK